MKGDTKPAEAEMPVGLMSDDGLADSTPMPGRRVRVKMGTPGSPASAAPPDLAAIQFSPLDEAYQEFCRRRAEGERLDPEEYCAQFPSMYSKLVRLMQVQFLLEEHSALFAETPDPVWPEAGATFLGYELLLQLGKGAFARVFLATEPRLGDRLVVVKISPRGGAEAEILGRIQHPNIVPVHSVQEDKTAGLTAVCMPYLGSATLCDVLDHAFPASARIGVILDAVKEHPFPRDPSAQSAVPASVLQTGTYLDGIRLIGAQLADALTFIHQRGICHRDLKPSNVLMSPEGVPMLLDFNLCADAKRRWNLLGGTLHYMSPEQLRAIDLKDVAEAPQLDARSDIFSLGVILYQLVTGLHPFGPVPLKLSTAELGQYLSECQRKGVREARQVNPNLDAAFSRLIQRCLALDPQDRPQSAAEIASALHRELTPVPRACRWIGRHPRKVMALALLVAALGLVGFALVAMRPSYSECQIETGLRLHKQGKYGEAVHHFNDALRADPNNNAALFARARSHQRLGAADMGKYNLAMQDYQELDKRVPDGRNKAALGYCLNRTGQDWSAVDHHKQAIAAGFATAEVYNNLGFSYLKVKKFKEAKDSLDRALQLAPDLQAAYHNRARVAYWDALEKFSRKGPLDKAKEIDRDLASGIADVQKAIGLGPASAELSLDAARLYSVAARLEDCWVMPALAHLEESLKQGTNPANECRNWVYDPFRKDAHFQKLANRPAVEKFAPTPRIADPIPDHAP
jgi:tetratricopeptide (TPR) repeat protein